MIGTMMSAYNNGCVAVVGASAEARVRAEKRSSLGDGVREETVDQDVTQVMCSFKGGEG